MNKYSENKNKLASNKSGVRSDFLYRNILDQKKIYRSTKICERKKNT